MTERKLRIRSHYWNKPLMKNVIFSAVKKLSCHRCLIDSKYASGVLFLNFQRQPTRKRTQTIRRQQLMNCLSVFGNFVRLALKVLRNVVTSGWWLYWTKKIIIDFSWNFSEKLWNMFKVNNKVTRMTFYCRSKVFLVNLNIYIFF